ncbi:MAG TPA: flavodoxin domain-containing protein [Actinomycetota bacterium]|nr:flavodoxin domain-containing protein [Actinomycetota bacterium]
MTTLVTYASKHGSTQGIAEAIAGRLRERGLDAEVRPLDEVDGLERYDAVVLGSAVYLGSWMKEARAFLDRHAEELDRVPMWLFSSGPTATDPIDRALSAKQLQRLDALGARDHHLFRGALDPGGLGFLERRAVKAARQPLGDFREWSDVQRWADAIADAAALAPA